LKEHEGKYVLIQGDRVDSFWDTEDDAVVAGDDRFGLTPFLVKKVPEKEEPLRLPPYVIPPRQSY
jgi:hypothetical protein